jgi:hypothetical protein
LSVLVPPRIDCHLQRAEQTRCVLHLIDDHRRRVTLQESAAARAGSSYRPGGYPVPGPGDIPLNAILGYYAIELTIFQKRALPVFNWLLPSTAARQLRLPKRSSADCPTRYFPGFTVTLALPVAEYVPLVADASTG